MTKHIFVTGGVVSSLGKGLNAASIGMLLESHGYKISLQKFDPYVNVDPGTMGPFEHGEIYVTEDGAETDLDLGHYERFTNTVTNRDCNCTTGSIYFSVITKERQGKYLGKTIQVIPHITNEIKDCISKLATADTDIVISEIGGIVGDIESQPFVEAIRQFGREIGKGNVLYIHLTLIPYLRAADEIKTKPTQHSVGMLRQAGIEPDILICRTEKAISDEIKEKISLFCNVDKESIIEEQDVNPYLYEIPLLLVREGLDKIILKKLHLHSNGGSPGKWLKMLEVLKNPRTVTEIAVVGKYIEHQSAYESIYEALTHGGIENASKVNVKRIESGDIEKDGPEKHLQGVNGILVPGGFGERGIEGKIETVRYARENNIPYLGLCLGMHCAAIEFARNVCNLINANSTEFDSNTQDPVICLLEEQKNIENMGATMRLGAQQCRLAPDTIAQNCYEQDIISERHRHRYEFNNKYRDVFANKGMICSGLTIDNELVEIIELKDHPWFVAVQFHPEFKSKPTKPHPLFSNFINATLETSKQ
ncbi:MAG: CTP synthase [Candidatus Brocadiaceae bacterium]|nr:CTP synthase [Candidatus Brocadiaceae bacterium]